MSHHTKLDEKIEGADNFRALKYRISLVLEGNDLANALHNKKLVIAKRIIADSIKDHLIP